MLAYTDVGEGTPIVFIHGLGGRKEAWLPQLQLAKNHRLILLDLRGHGETVLNDDITIENFAMDIVKLLAYLNIKSAYVCGLSLGGIIAQELYKQRPDMVRGLILANTTSYIPSIFTYGAINESTRAFNTGGLLEDIVERGLYDQVYKEEAKKAFYIRDAYLASAKSAIGLNYFPLLYSINKPVLLIGSTHDKVTPLANLHLMKFCIKNARSVIFNKTGHLSNIEQGAEFNKFVGEFVG